MSPIRGSARLTQKNGLNRERRARRLFAREEARLATKKASQQSDNQDKNSPSTPQTLPHTRTED